MFLTRSGPALLLCQRERGYKMKFEEDLKAIGAIMDKRGIMSKEIDENMTVKTTAAGTACVFDRTGGLVDPKDLTAEDQNTIRKEFGIEEEDDFDSNPLLDFGDELPKKEKGKSENEYDNDPLIP